MWNTVLLPVLVSVCWRIADGNSTQMCENNSLSRDDVFLYRTDQDVPTNCWCHIKSETGRVIKVLFRVSCFIGQQYKLSVSSEKFTSYFENSMSPDIFYTISGSEEIKLKLEENDCSVNNGLEFGIIINSNQGPMNITCHKPTPELCKQANSPVTTSSVKNTSTITTNSTVRPTCDITTKFPVTEPTTISSDTDSISSPVTEPTTISEVTDSILSVTDNISSEISVTKSNDTSCNKYTDELVAGLIGGLVICIIVVIVLVIVIVCIVRRQQQKEEFYSHSLTVRPPPDDGYTPPTNDGYTPPTDDGYTSPTNNGRTDSYLTPTSQKPGGKY